MKIKLIISIFLIAGFCFSSCSDILDKSPDGRIDLEQIFKDNDRVAALLNQCYSFLPNKSINYMGWSNYPTVCSDEAWGYVGDEYLAGYYGNTVTSINHPFINSYGSQAESNMIDYWKRYFSQIRICTQFINGIDNAAVDEPRNRKRWKAEAYVLRAYYLSELIKWYGPIPLNNMELYELTHDYSTAVRNNVWEVAEAIEADCRAAINGASDIEFPYRNRFVPTQTSGTTGEELRVNKAVAWTLMAKMYLFAASDLYNKGVPEDVRRERWKKAYDINKEAVSALEANDFKLLTEHTIDAYNDFGKAAAFYQINASYDAPTVDKETIWQNNRRSPSSWSLNSIPGLPGTSMYVAFWPSQELVDAFEVVEYDPAGNITKAVPLLNLRDPYLDGETGHLNPNLNPEAISLGYKETDPYEVKRDPRLYATILRNGDKISWNSTNDITVESYVGGEHSIVFVSGNAKNSKTGYYSRKFWCPGVSDNNRMSDPAWKYFRLAEVKLNLAESAIEYAIAKGGDLNLQKEGAAQIDDIRKRVGMPSLPTAVVADGDEMRLRLRNERRIEFAFEEHRFFDVRRWTGADGDLSATDKFMSAMEITESGGIYKYKRVHVNKKENGPTRAGGWQNKYLLLPIDREDVIRMRNATGVEWQNPGWN